MKHFRISKMRFRMKGVYFMDGIIFDVDGTIWDSTAEVAESWNQALRDHSDLDLEITPEILSKLFGKTMDEIYEALFPDLPHKEQVRLGDLCYEYENILLETKPGRLYNGIIETITTLAKKYKIYIVSNCQLGYIDVMLKTTGLGSYVEDFLCYGHTLAKKSVTIKELMERNQLKDVVYIGDTEGDATACFEANIPFIFAAYGFGEVPDAQVRIDKPIELLDLIP